MPPQRSAAEKNRSVQAISSAAEWRRTLGRKVSLRYRLRDDPEHPFSEAIGVVQSVNGEGEDLRISIVNRKAEVTVVSLADIEAAKLWPAD